MRERVRERENNEKYEAHIIVYKASNRQKREQQWSTTRMDNAESSIVPSSRSVRQRSDPIYEALGS